MKITDTVRRAGRSLRQAKARTLLTSLAIGVGAFTLTLAFAAGEGARQYADKLITSNIDPQALFIVKDKTLFEQGAGGETAGIKEYDPDSTQLNSGAVIKRLTQADIDKLQARSDLTDIQPIYQPTAKYVTFEGNSKKYTADLDLYNSNVRSEAAFGTLPPLGQQLADDETVIPESFADIIGIPRESLVGRKVTLYLTKPAQTLTQEQINAAFQTGGIDGVTKLSEAQSKTITLTIRGIAKKSATALSSSSAMQLSAHQGKALSDYRTEGTDNYQKYIGATAKAKSNLVPEDVKASLDKAGYASQTAKDLQGLLFTIANVLQSIVAGFGILALIASVFGIINTQYISVLERTQQIGLMKALGMRRRDVSRLFRYEAAWIGFIGGVIGVGLAIVAGLIINPLLASVSALGGGEIKLIFTPLPAVGIIVGLMLIAVIAGYFPSRKAAKLDPIEALRTE